MTASLRSTLTRRRRLAALVVAMLLTGACTSGGSSDPTVTPSRASSTPRPSSAHRSGPDLVDAGDAGAVREAPISAYRKKLLRGQNVSFTTHPVTPASGGGPDDREVLGADRDYTVHDDVYVLRGTVGIALVAKNANVSRLTPFLGTAGHVYRVSGVVTPLPGKGTYTLQTLDPRDGRVGTSTTTAFVAR